MYPAFISLSNIDKVSIYKVMTNNIGDKLSPWKMSLFIFNSSSISPPDVNSTFEIFIDFSITFLILSATFKILRNHAIGFLIVYQGNTQLCHSSIASSIPKTLKYWIGLQRGQSYLMGRRCLLNCGWPPFLRWHPDKNTFEVDVLLHQPASHPIFFYWVG